MIRGRWCSHYKRRHWVALVLLLVPLVWWFAPYYLGLLRGVHRLGG